MNIVEKRLNIPYIKLRFSLVFEQDTILPKNKVSALRGGMGEMLLQQNCIKDRNCKSCQFEEACIVHRTLYTKMKKKLAFMQGEDSIGYLIECENNQIKWKAGEKLFFFLTLFGDNIVYFSQYLQAFHQLGLQGIGKYASKYNISSIVNEKGEQILYGNTVNLAKYQPESVYYYALKRKNELQQYGYKKKIIFHTPLSLKYRGEYIQEFHVEAFFQALFRRIMMLDYFVKEYIDAPELILYPNIIEQSVQKCLVKRYSSTQNTKINLRGIQGHFYLDDIPEEYLLYVLAGELLHIGKNSSFGFGRYQLS